CLIIHFDLVEEARHAIAGYAERAGADPLLRLRTDREVDDRLREHLRPLLDDPAYVRLTAYCWREHGGEPNAEMLRRLAGRVVQEAKIPPEGMLGLPLAKVLDYVEAGTPPDDDVGATMCAKALLKAHERTLRGEPIVISQIAREIG